MRNLNTINIAISVETAAAIVKMMNSRLQEWYKGSRPYVSDKGAMTVTLAFASSRVYTLTYSEVQN